MDPRDPRTIALQHTKAELALLLRIHKAAKKVKDMYSNVVRSRTAIFKLAHTYSCVVRCCSVCIRFRV